jgi:hypothetical protein
MFRHLGKVAKVAKLPNEHLAGPDIPVNRAALA